MALLREVPLFAGLNEANLAALVADFRERSYRASQIIFHQGDESHTVYVVMKGKVRVFHLSLTGEETTVTILSHRHLLGEFGVIDGQPRAATAETIDPCTLLEMSGAKFVHSLEIVPGLALNLCKQLVSKARWTSMYAETIARLDAAGRLLHFLLLYNAEFGQPMAEGRGSVLELGLNQSDLATLVGAHRGWVNTILQDWRKRGLMAFDDGKITLLDLPRIKAERDRRIKAQQG
jgi:CRP-like cAMP-binding protein